MVGSCLSFSSFPRSLVWLALLGGGCASQAATPAQRAEHERQPPLVPPSGADVKSIAQQGQALTALEPHLVPGKVTVFDFYASWCAPCRKVDEHLYPIAGGRSDLAIRKVDIGSWESAVAERWLGDAPELPYLLVFDKRGQKVATLVGGDLRELDRALAKASQ